MKINRSSESFLKLTSAFPVTTDMTILLSRWKFRYHGLLVLVFCLCVQTAFSQAEITPKRLDFGTTNPDTEWIVDVKITGKSAQKDFVLRHTFSHEYEVLFSSKTILPDSTITMRVKFKPRMKGAFKENIQLYFASMQQSVIFPVTAFVDYKNPADNIPCPDFSQRTPDCCASNQFEVEVIDKETKAPIGKASVKVVEDGTLQAKLETGKEGKARRDIPIGYYQLIASHKDYFSESIISYVNLRKSYFKFELERIPEAIVENSIEEEKPEVVEIIKEPKEEPERDEITIITGGVPEPPVPTVVITSEVMPEDKYNPNNIVFLLDVSGSMNQKDRLELMKGTLRQLVKVLRPSDKITLISYSDDAKILLATTSGDQKGEIMPIVEELKIAGATNASKGFKTAYNVLKKQQIKGGNNQLIAITDGAFEVEEQKAIDKMVRKSARKSFVTSVMGVRCQSYAVRKLTEVSEVGNGSFLLIEDENDLNIIIDELKKRSAK